MRVSERGQGLSEGGDLVILSGSGVFSILNGNVVSFFGRKFPFWVYWAVISNRRKRETPVKSQIGPLVKQ